MLLHIIVVYVYTIYNIYTCVITVASATCYVNAKIERQIHFLCADSVRWSPNCPVRRQ